MDLVVVIIAGIVFMPEPASNNLVAYHKGFIAEELLAEEAKLHGYTLKKCILLDCNIYKYSVKR